VDGCIDSTGGIRWSNKGGAVAVSVGVGPGMGLSLSSKGAGMRVRGRSTVRLSPASTGRKGL
jgi:hypothetical protein